MFGSLKTKVKKIIKTIEESFIRVVYYYYFEIGNLKVVCRILDSPIDMVKLTDIAMALSKRKGLDFEHTMKELCRLYENNGIRLAKEYSENPIHASVIIDGKVYRFYKNPSFVFIEM